MGGREEGGKEGRGQRYRLISVFYGVIKNIITVHKDRAPES